MGLTYANIELINGDDFADARRGRIGEDEVRQLTIHTMVDTGSIMLCIQVKRIKNDTTMTKR